MAFLLLSFCYLVIDVLGWWNGAPFCYPGWYLLSKKYHTRSDCSRCVILLDVFLKLYFIVPYWVEQSNPHKCSLAQLCGTVDIFSAQTWYENQQVRHHMKWIFLFFFCFFFTCKSYNIFFSFRNELYFSLRWKWNIRELLSIQLESERTQATCRSTCNELGWDYSLAHHLLLPLLYQVLRENIDYCGNN